MSPNPDQFKKKSSFITYNEKKILLYVFYMYFILLFFILDYGY